MKQPPVSMEKEYKFKCSEKLAAVLVVVIGAAIGFFEHSQQRQYDDGKIAGYWALLLLTMATLQLVRGLRFWIQRVRTQCNSATVMTTDKLLIMHALAMSLTAALLLAIAKLPGSECLFWTSLILLILWINDAIWTLRGRPLSWLNLPSRILSSAARHLLA